MAAKRKRRQPLYSGGNGESRETAIVIGTASLKFLRPLNEFVLRDKHLA